MYRTFLATLALLPLIAGRTAAQPKFDPPKTFPPDAATLRQIEAKTAELRKAVAALPKDTPEDVVADVEVYAKAAEWIVRHGEWFTKDSGKQTLAVLDAGLERAKAVARGKKPWRDVRGKPVVRGFRSRIDGSVQPYAVTLPEGFGEGEKKWRWDVVLHGRDQTLTEVKFIQAREKAKPAAKPSDYVVLEPYGRGNNAYRWAGETDVFEAEVAFARGSQAWLDDTRRVLRGFSMGGAGTWHIGLHYPFRYAVIGPGAGFTTTRGYVKNLPTTLPDYQEACLHIYDAADYAENAFDVPVVAYSGEKDPQKAAADAIEARLKAFKEPVRFTHLIAPGLEHRMPPEWQARADAEYRKHLTGDREKLPDHVRFVTYTVRYNNFGHGTIRGLDRHYAKAVVESRRAKDSLVMSTTNVRDIVLYSSPPRIVIDGQRLVLPKGTRETDHLDVRKSAGKWEVYNRQDVPIGTSKTHGLEPIQGPIDDAFMAWFTVVPPTGAGWHPAVDKHVAASLARFGAEWDKFFRGRLPTPKPGKAVSASDAGNLVLFGDPQSNPLIAEVVGKLPIVWTRERLVVGGKEYDPKTHVPVLIYPNPGNPSFYVVINSGHTFHEADLKGTNALLYPRLGDWAVLKPTPTGKDPAAAEVVAAGLFDEFWQFPKK
jgi:hypothetical protein